MHGDKPTAKRAIRKNSAQFEAVCRELLGRGLAVRFTAEGESMRPNILPQEQVLVAPVDAGEMRAGDVVLTRASEGLRVHRMVQRLADSGAAITRGDAGLENDAPAEAILGRVLSAGRPGEQTSFARPWTPLWHATKTLARRVQLARRRRLARHTFLFLPLAVLLHMFGGLSAAQAVAVTLTQTPSSTTVGAGTTYTITDQLVNNSGTTAVNKPTISQAFPNNTTYVSVSATGSTCTTTASAVNCQDNANLAANGTISITVTFTVNTGTAAGTVLTGAATVTSTTALTGTTTASNPATVTSADLALAESVLNGQLTATTVTAPGTELIFLSIVTNNGPSTANAPQVVIPVPGNTTYSTYIQQGGFTCTVATNTATCTLGSTLASGSSVGVGIVVYTNEGTAVGTVITGTGTVSSTTTDPTSSNNSASASATVASLDLAMTQTASPSVVASGSTITYTETITNNGPAPAGDVVLYQATPANTTFSSISLPTGFTATTVPASGGTGQVIITDGSDFYSGATVTVTYVVTVNSATAAGTSITNSADVTSIDVDNNPANNASSTTVLTESSTMADVAVSISAAPTPVFVSSTLTYTILVRNLGLTTSASVTLSDPLPTGTTLVSATSTQGSACTGTTTVSCVLGTLASGASATVTIAVTTPTTATTLTNTASYTPTTNDPVSTNNSATAITVVQPLVCATPGHDGAPGTVSSIVNAYYAPAANGVVAAGSTTVTLGAVVTGGASTAIASGDLLLFIQMQDAAINSTNTSSYGDGAPGDPASGETALNNAGNFEFVTVTTGIANTGGTVTFTGTGPNGGLLNTYTEAAYVAGTMGQRKFQVIRVPQYTSATLASGFTALAWNGSVGGVAAIDVSSQLTLGGPVVLDALGFRGGGGRKLTGGSGANTDYVTLSTNNANGSKGEGIAGTPIYLANSGFTALVTGTVEGYPNGSYARGAPGNAGAGATDAHPSSNDQNTGGGGGGNGGTGGQGGYGWNSAGIEGGFGGTAFPATTSAMVLGGGGGAGTTNDGTAYPANTNPAGINSSGAAGGGLLIIHAGSVTGTGTITANGQNALNVANDGGGGGGAGGSIRVLANSGSLSGLTVQANGGTGGYTWQVDDPGLPFPGNRHGPGGGGAGGVLELSGTPNSASSVAGGINGGTDTVQDAYGATPGTAGTENIYVTIPQTPGTQPGAECATADLSVTNTATPNPVAPGGTITYTQVVTNSGPLDALNAVFSEPIPANTTFSSLTPPSGWTCNSNASILSTGTITCTDADFANRAFGTFTLAVTVNAGTTFGTQIVSTDNISSGTTDPTLANNTATATTVVGTASSAYVTLTKTAASPTVIAGNNITYTMVMKNNGPAAAAPNGLYDTVPTNTTFVSITQPSGWSCSTPLVGGTGSFSCTTTSFANGATATFVLVVNVNAGVASGTVISNTANANSGIPNPNPTAASATANVTVAGATQSDLSITSSVTPNPIYNNSANPVFTQVVTNNGPAAVTTATYTDTVPTGSTFVSLTIPSGWTCPTLPSVGGTGAISCTGSLAVGATVTFPLTVAVTSADTAGTVITNTATVGPTATDPNTANNTASSSTVLASPSQADVAIVKTATPEPVDQNTNLTYTLQVTNNGPAVATGVMVSDPLPSQVTYVSVSTTQGTCTQSSGTVNCSLGSISVGAVVIITINTTATTYSGSGGTVCDTVNGVPYSVCNIATVTTTPTSLDPNTSNNSSEADSTIQSPTAVQLSSFRAVLRPQGGVILEWHTQEEIRNLGFNLYREDAAGRHRVNPSIIAGAALFVRGAQPQHAAKTYQWIDAAGTAQASYVLEDVDLNGTRTSHGPVSAEVSSENTPQAAASVQAGAEVVNAPLLTQLNQLAVSAGAAPTRALVTPQPKSPVVTAGQYQASLDLVPALKIGVTSEGWYSVSRAQMIAAGFDPGLDTQNLQLYAEGVEQPMAVSARQGTGFRTFQGIEFYGTGIDTPYSGTREYWLVRGTQPGKRVTHTAASASGSTAQDFLFTVIRQDRTTYFATLLNGEDQDNFFGDAVTSAPVDELLTVGNLSANSALPATVDVTLQGATDQQAHAVAVSFNGNPLGEMDFLNQANVTNTFSINASMLQEGVNTVTLTALNGDNDVSLVQAIQLHYPHTYAADGNWLRATASAGTSLKVTGFSNAQISALDITDPLAITQLEGQVQAEGSTFAISLGVPNAGAATRTLLIFSADQISAPAAFALHAPDPAIHKQQRSDIVVISHPDFVASLAPFVVLRQSQGRQVSVVTTDQIYDAFNYGERTPYAIQAYLQQLSAEPQLAPQAVLLVGDASLDPRNYLGFGSFDFVPTRIIETQAFKTASDDWFSDFQQTGFATIPTGRLPVRTPADAALLIAKIVNYESGASAGSWNQQAVLIADQNDGVNFSNEAAFANTELPASLQSTKIMANGLDVDTARQQILNALNSGALLVNYTGHGAEEQWSFADLFDNSTAAGLSNGNRLPFYLLMDCLNGFFQDVYAQSLAQSLMLAPNGGAVAVWASSGFTSAPPQATMDQALLRILKNAPATPLGQAALGAKLGATDPDVRRTWILFGDPSMELQLPSPPAHVNSGPGRGRIAPAGGSANRQK
jgi:uncharacterized repeat protein (TIGR01451 family)